MEAYLDDGNGRFPLTGSVNVIGRDRRNCTLVFDDELMSRRHAYILRQAGPRGRDGWVILDINSSNGVNVNGRLVDFEFLRDGDRITLGGLELSFHVEEAAGEVEPAGATPKLPPTGADVDRAGRHTSAEFVRVLKDKTLVLPAADKKDALKSDFDKLLILYKVNRLVTSETDLDTLLAKVVDLAMEVLDADRVSIMFRTRDGLVPKIQRARDREQIESGLLHISQKISQFCLEKNEPVITQDALVDQRFQKSASIQMYNIRSAMVSPLLNRDEPFGVLYVDNRIHGDCFDEDDLRLLEAFADSVAIAIVNSRLIYELRKSLNQVKTQQEALVQSEKLAAMGQLSAGISHEIRGPLTAISGYVQFYFAKFQEGSPFYDKMKRIEEALDAINGIVGGLLDLARKGEGRMEKVEVGEVIEATLKIAERSLTKVGTIQVTRRLDAGVPHVLGDRRQLQQVFLNLMLNAAQAMPEGGTLTLETRVGKALGNGNQAVEVCVADTGRGMSAEVRTQIFQPFFTQGKKGGTGLGLAITKNIVDIHGGEIDVESEPGQGTTFVIRLPTMAALRGQGAGAAAVPGPVEPGTGSSSGSGSLDLPDPLEDTKDKLPPGARPTGAEPVGKATDPEIDVGRITESGSVTRTRSGSVVISNLTAGGGDDGGGSGG